MKWSNHIQIITGQTYVQIAMHSLVMAALIWGWKHKALVEVCSTLVATYALVFIAVLVRSALPGYALSVVILKKRPPLTILARP